MTVPGNDCPECGARLNGQACRKCGWEVVDVKPAIPNYRKCLQCEDTNTINTEFGRLCASHHVDELRKHAAPPEVAAMYRAKIREILSRFGSGAEA